MGVVGHVKHRVVTKRPRSALFALRPVHQHMVVFVDVPSDVGVPATAKDGCRASVRVDPGEIDRCY